MTKVIHFVLNSTGGRGRALKRWNKIKDYMERHGLPYQLHKTEARGDAEKIARSLTENTGETKDTVVLGGDGTVNEFINGIVNFTSIRLGVIPSGSGNDFARELKIKKHAPLSTLRKIIAASQKEESPVIDLGEVTFKDDTAAEKTKKFAISSGFGMDAIVCEKVDHSRLKTFLNRLHIGKLAYLIKTFTGLFTMKKFDLNVSFDDEQKILSFKKALFFSSMNFRKQGGGVNFAPDAKYDDGKLSLCMAFSILKIKCFFILPFLVKGWHRIFRGFYFRNFRKAEVVSSTATTLHTDGEVFTGVRKFSVKVSESRLSILL